MFGKCVEKLLRIVGLRLAPDYYVYSLLRYHLIPDWHRRLASLGHGVVITWDVHIGAPERVSIGDRTSFGAGCYVHGTGGVTVGADVMIAPRVSIWSSNHNYERSDVLIANQGVRCAAVVIHDGVWIGYAATILPGVTVERGAVIAAGSVVTRSVEEFAVVAGVPARVIGYRKPAGERDRRREALEHEGQQ